MRFIIAQEPIEIQKHCKKEMQVQKDSGYDQEILQPHTADQPIAPPEISKNI